MNREREAAVELLCDWLRNRVEFAEEEVPIVFDQSPVQQRLCLHAALDRLREEDRVEFSAVFGRPGVRRRIEGMKVLHKSERFARSATRKLMRTRIMGSNVDVNRLAPDERATGAKLKEKAMQLASVARLFGKGEGR